MICKMYDILIYYPHMEIPQSPPLDFKKQFMKNEEVSISETEQEIPIYTDQGQNYIDEWSGFLRDDKNDFPIEASFANHFFKWPHIIKWERREEFDCTDVDSYRLIPPSDYLKAYREAKGIGTI